jgi:hypothetical protein
MKLAFRLAFNLPNALYLLPKFLNVTALVRNFEWEMKLKNRTVCYSLISSFGCTYPFHINGDWLLKNKIPYFSFIAHYAAH